MNSILFRISIRNLLKNKFTSLVCVFGLSLGFVAYILISLLIRYEMSWDKANENYDNIYLVERNISLSSHNIGNHDISPFTPAITAPMLEGYSGFEKVTVIYEIQDKFLSITPEELFRIDRGLYADHNYFNVFTYQFVDGYPVGDFNEPFSLVISESLANRFFTPGEAVGQIISLDKKTDLKVTGVYVDLPVNSSIRPEYIISFSTLEKTEGISRNDLWSISCMTFTLLSPDSDPPDIEDRVKGMLAGFDGMESETLLLTPLSKIRFNSVPDYYTIIWIFGLVAILILTMSAFNYVNLLMANTSIRGKEIAIKKMNGSSRSRLVVQFLGETVLLSILAVAISFYLISFLLPFFNNMMNTSIVMNFYHDLQFTGLLVLSSLVIGLIAGIYPAFFMSSNSIISLFKGSFNTGSDKIKLRKTLVLLQFAISVFLICLSMFFLSQVNHLTGKDVGFNRENLVYVQLTSSVTDRYFDGFRSRLLQNPAIINASMSANLPFVNFGGSMISWEGGNPGEKAFCRPNLVTYDFVETLGMHLIEGRNFSREHTSDIDQACIINETAIRNFGWDDPIGKRLDNNRFTVVGVVKDYHLMDIHNPIEPLVLKLVSDEMAGEWIFAFRYIPGSRDEVFEILKNEFAMEFPNDPFYIDELDSAFRNESAFVGYQMLRNSMLFFTVFNIFLAVTGLLGLVSFSVARRTKEIGIRKITGSSIWNIFILLNREFFMLLGISVIIAWPGVWMVHNAFPGAHKLPLNPWILIISAITILMVTLLSTGWQTWKAANRNPVEALRYE